MKFGDEVQRFLAELEPHEIADSDVASLRFQTCLGCPEFNRETRECRICWCYMPVKTRLAVAECPIGKW